MFASYANRTGLHLVSPRMLIAQDFMFASYANCTGLDLVSPRMLIAQDFMFASYANCTGLDFRHVCLDLLVTASSPNFHFFHLDLPLIASLVEI